jgi:ParB-like chromosome segregation protein Spo0J
MPQINDTDIFQQELTKNKIDYHIEVINDLSTIRPTQVNYDETKVKDMIDSFKTDSDRVADSLPIVISRSKDQSDFVLDGHHRYYAALQAGKSINALVVDMPINKLMAMTNLFNQQQATDSVDSDAL